MTLVRLYFAQPVLRPTMHEYIVKVMGRVGTVLTHHVSHHSVECRRCVFQPLWHHKPLPQHTAWGAYCRFGYISISHENLIVAILQIQRGKDS